MADADWAKYKQIRGQSLPATIEFANVKYFLTKIFKRDFYAATGLYQRLPNATGQRINQGQPPEHVVFKHYHTDPLGFLPLRWLGRWLWRREMRFAREVAEIPGVAHVLGRLGKSGLIREYIPGQNLHEYLAGNTVKQEFFAELKETLAQIHAKGIAHNDLNKPENILVRTNGSPVVIDFQIALQSRTRVPVLSHIGQAVLRYLQRMDYYHILKHHGRHSPMTLSAADRITSKRRGILLNLHAWLLRRPYRSLRHLIMGCFFMAKNGQ